MCLILPLSIETRYAREMGPRIQLDDSAPNDSVIRVTKPVGSPPPSRQLLDADWEDSKAGTLVLYVAEEPRAGLEFSHHGLACQIVEYDDRWIAKMPVD